MQLRKTNPTLSWWGPKFRGDEVEMYQCPTNLTADSMFNTSSHCPVNSFGASLDLTSDTILSFASSEYTTID